MDANNPYAIEGMHGPIRNLSHAPQVGRDEDDFIGLGEFESLVGEGNSLCLDIFGLWTLWVEGVSWMCKLLLWQYGLISDDLHILYMIIGCIFFEFGGVDGLLEGDGGYLSHHQMIHSLSFGGLAAGDGWRSPIIW